MHFKIFQMIFSVVLLLTAISANAQKVTVGFDRSIEFAKFKTYSWSKGVPAKNPLIDQQIIAAIDQQLQAKGLRRLDENGDLNVSYHAAVGMGYEQAAVAQPSWASPSMVHAWDTVVGSLIVELQDGASKTEVWRAAATETLSNDSTKDVSKDVNKATKKVKQVVEKMFKKFPPAKTAS